MRGRSQQISRRTHLLSKMKGSCCVKCPIRRLCEVPDPQSGALKDTMTVSSLLPPFPCFGHIWSL